MRSLVFSSSRRLVFALALAGAARGASAQRGLSDEGVVFLLLPLGARITASGQSIATPQASSEQLYWNPGAIARADKREFALHYGSFFVGPLIAGAAVLPMGRAGVAGASIAVLDYGSQEVGDITGPSGTFSQQSYIFSATYAATLRTRAVVGVTFKNAQFVSTCTGLCPPIATFHVSTSAIDIGAQYRVLKDDDLVLAVALRHVGLKFQLNDEPQSDPLPSRMQVGASYRVRAFDDDLPGTVLRVNADLIDRAREPGGAAMRFGVDAEWREQVAVRAGYVDGTGEGTGFAVGFGFVNGRAAIDIAHALGARSGSPVRGSTYFSLRGRW